MKLHFRDRRRLALSRYRNRAEITFLMCERKPYLGMALLPARELSSTVGHSPTRRTPLFQFIVYLKGGASDMNRPAL